jgi:hypothetical protein
MKFDKCLFQAENTESTLVERSILTRLILIVSLPTEKLSTADITNCRTYSGLLITVSASFNMTLLNNPTGGMPYLSSSS